MKQILKGVISGLVELVTPTKKPKYIRPKLCQCTKCGQVHYRAIAE